MNMPIRDSFGAAFEHSAPIPLFTSLPPRMARQTVLGDEIGEDYARRCFGSWVASGFRPVTVNARSESISPLYRALGVETRRLDRDASAICGRPLPYFADLIEEMRASGPGVVALTNADIQLRLTPADLTRIRTLKRGECVVAHRVDVDYPEMTTGPEYDPGFDFFALHAEDLPAIRDCPLVFGLPWWDHFLPLLLLMRGLRRVDISIGSVVHLQHDDRWDPQSWQRMGADFLPTLRASLTSGIDPRYLLKARLTNGPARLRGVPRYLARFLSSSGRARNRTLSLHRLSALNVDTIARWPKALQAGRTVDARRDGARQMLAQAA